MHSDALSRRVPTKLLQLLIRDDRHAKEETMDNDRIARNLARISTFISMAKQSASLKVVAPALSEALRFALALEPHSESRMVAQREMVTALENAMDARRQRIIASRSSVNWIKWSCLSAQAACMLIAIAIVHCDNRGSAAIAMGIFAIGVAVSALLILAHDRPFSGYIAVKPDLLQQARPE
jgi:hypothetical protein